MKTTIRTAIAGSLLFSLYSLQAAVFFVPTAYQSRTNSPFFQDIANHLVYLETFESGALRVPGVSAPFSFVVPPTPETDSVDADDGTIDGLGRGYAFGSCVYSSALPAAIRFSFDTNILGRYPQKAGIVWTGGGSGRVNFEAFGPQGNSLGSVQPPAFGDNKHGFTAGDRLFGATNISGISAILIRNVDSLECIEVDLQYGYFELPSNSTNLSIYVSDIEICWLTRPGTTYRLQYRTEFPTSVLGRSRSAHSRRRHDQVR